MKLSNSLMVQCNRVGFNSWLPMHSLKSAFDEGIKRLDGCGVLANYPPIRR